MPKTFDDLITAMRILGRLFGFQMSNIHKEENDAQSRMKSATISDEQRPRVLLSRRLHHTLHEVGGIHNIINIIKETAQEQVDILKIEEAYTSDFAIEIISSSVDIFCHWQEDLQYDQLATKLSKILYGFNKPFPMAVSVVACRIILCDDLSQLKTIARKLKLKKIRRHVLYLGGKDPNITYNMFNFISGSWREIFISNPIATLKPENLQSQGYHTTVDELNFLISLIHSLGKFYVISESSRAIQANLEWLSWYLDDLFERFELRYCWLQRNLSNLEKDLREIEKTIKSEVLPLSRIATSPESVSLIERVYGVEYLPYVQSFLSLLRRFNVENYKIPKDDLIKSVFDDLKSLSRSITKFWREFSGSGNSWKELRRSIVTSNQLLLTLFGLLITLIVDILFR